ncbi:FAD-dependent oxidoreductase [Williamsia sp. MIQD14]|uniref:FAD-dependent oxidoreductase n=1 Tax=Williamsia sp. MIQD14 TaxID=3425703 RepID=UPI003DA1C194
MRTRVGIAGAGAAATAIAARLVDRLDDVAIHCFDSWRLGSSLAFSTTGVGTTCNTSTAANSGYLSALGGAPRDPAVTPMSPSRDFVGRDVIGHAVAATAQRLRDRHRGELHEALGPVVSIRRDGRSLTVESEGSRVDGLRAMFLCRGLTEPTVPPELLDTLAGLGIDSDRIIPSPYPLDTRLRDVHDQRVLVIGSGLSAVEAALALAECGCRVTIASRSGRLPSVRATLPDDPELARWFSSRIRAEVPCNPEHMTRLLFSWFAELGYPLPDGAPTRSLAREIDECTAPRHWAVPIVPLCRAVNALPRFRTVSRAALEAFPFRRHTNALNLPSALRLNHHMMRGAIDVARLGDVIGPSEQFGPRRTRLRDIDTTVLACGWQTQPAPWADASIPTTSSVDAVWYPEPHIVRIGVEAHADIAVPNALFALDQQLADLDAGRHRNRLGA